MKLLSFSLLAFALLYAATSVAQSGSWTEKEKKEIFAALESSRQELLKTVAPLTENQFFFRPDEKSWSANDIVEHLGVIEEGYVREFWWALSQPTMPAAYRDSTKGGDERAIAYTTSPNKSEARGTNLPLQRYCTKETCVRVFTTARDLSVDFFTKNGSADLRGYYVFRKNARGIREIRDLHQQALWMIAHTIRHTNQLKQVLEAKNFPKK